MKDRARHYLLPVALGVAVLLQSPPASADVDSVQGVATGVVVSGFLGAIPPTPTVVLNADESSPPSALGPFAGTSAGTSLPGFVELFSTGALSVSTSAANLTGENHAGSVESRAVVLDVDAGAGLATATSIASVCTASGNGSTGTTFIQGALFNGEPFANGTPAPNTVIQVPEIGTVILNEQVCGDPAGSAVITVNAVHARYTAGPGGVLPQGQSTEAKFGQVLCRAVGPDVNVLPTTTTTTVARPSTTLPPTTVVGVTTTVAPTLASSGPPGHLGPAVVLVGAAVLLRLLARRSA